MNASLGQLTTPLDVGHVTFDIEHPRETHLFNVTCQTSIVQRQMELSNDPMTN